MTDLARTCMYAGIIDIPIRTFTSTYTSIIAGSWNLAATCQLPMDFRGYISNNTGIGMWARIFDLNTGTTEIKIGNVTPANENTANFNYPIWQNNSLMGWFLPQLAPANHRAFAYSYAAVLGQGYTTTRPFAYFGSAPPMPDGLPNTGYGQGNQPLNQPSLNNGVTTGGWINLVPQEYVYQLSGGIGGGPFDMDLGGSSGVVVSGYGSYLGASWATTDVPSTPSSRRRLLQTDYSTYTQHYQMTWQNPVGADLDTLMILTGGSVSLATVPGFATCFHDNVTINGTTTPYGFCMLMTPDGTKYYVLRFLPVDATAANTLSSLGQITAKFDLSGAIWFKNTTIQNVLLVTAGSVLKQLPLYFPVPLPDSFDAEPNVRIMRSEQ